MVLMYQMYLCSYTQTCMDTFVKHTLPPCAIRTQKKSKRIGQKIKITTLMFS